MNIPFRLKRSLFVSGLLVTGLSTNSCKSTNSQSAVKDVIPFDQEDQAPSLGENYDSLIQRLNPGTRCANGVTEKISGGKSDVSLKQSNQFDKISTELTGEVKGTPRVPFFVGSASGGYFSSLTTSSSSVGVIYTAKVISGSEKLTNVALTEEAKALDPLKQLQLCGDSYVAQINRGGVLTIGINFDFGSEVNRRKWQSLINVNVSLASLNSDLKDKFENNEVEGTMSINVHQEGGNPEQAMLGVKSCALNSVEDVARCQEQIAEVMTYASTNFPTQIQNSPGIVSYTTAPLFALGGKTIPAIPQDILAARKDLAAMAKANYQLESMITQSKVKGLPVESAVEDSVSSNKQLIRDAGLTCFQYQIGETALDWSACKVALAQVQATLVPIPSSTVMVHQGAIVGNEMNGYSIYNPYGKKITVNYVIDKDDQWNYGTRANPSFNGVDPSNPNLKQFSKNSVVPDTRQGTLLLRKGDDYETSPNSGSLEIYPGDGVSFLMNDELGKYSDNSGALSISWRCQDCSQSALRPTELLNLSASSADGVTFINRQATQASYSVKAYGLWRNSRSFGFTNSRGYDQICGPSCPMPDEIDQLLVVQTPSESIALGNEGNFTLAPGQKATFIHNDDANSYRDNEGELVLIIQCTNCP